MTEPTLLSLIRQVRAQRHATDALDENPPDLQAIDLNNVFTSARRRSNLTLKPSSYAHSIGISCMFSSEASAADSAKHPTMHKTDSIDYLVVISGSMHMLMEDGEVELHAGDCIVQRGTHHAWVNRSGKPCVLAAVLIDAKPAP
jgi:mannose-6-phosphate isomerase-like protein (cupin superfamily)